MRFALAAWLFVVTACGSPTSTPDGGSSDGATLDVQSDAGDASTQCPSVLVEGDGGTAPTNHTTTTALSTPATLKSSNHQNDPLAFAGYLDVTLYGADPKGQADSTQAFQQALDDASGDSVTTLWGASMVVYVPPGTYKITNTLTGTQTGATNGSVHGNPKYGSISEYGGLSAPSLVGPARGPRPTLVLTDNATGFGDPNAPKPVIHLVNLPNGTPQCGGQYVNPAVGCFDILFNAVIRDINVKTGNNAGAVGIQFYSAQQSYMQNVLVDATNGYAGIQGAPATDMWTNIEVTGGQYGVMIDSTAGVSAVAGLTLENQSVAGLRTRAIGDVAVTGFDIRETASGATAVAFENGTSQGSTLSMIDGTIKTAATGQPAIANQGGSLYLRNVYIQTPANLIVNSGSTSITSSGAMQMVREYAHADQSTNAPAMGYPLACTIVIDDKKQTTDVGPTFGAGAPPADLVIRHLPGDMPWAFDANAFWVTDFSADPTGFIDSTKPIQATIEAAHVQGSDEVFLPRGDYSLSGTLKLYPNTKFFGIPGSYARLFGFGWVTGHTLAAYMQVGDATADPAGAKNGRAIVSDIGFFMPVNAALYAPYLKLLPSSGAGYDPADQLYLYGLDWQTGQSSVLNQCWVSFQYASTVPSSSVARDLIRAHATGGGRWYGLQIAGDYGADGSSGNMVAVTGSSAPLTLYGSNLEHGYGAAFYNFSGTANVRVLGAKTEGGPAKYWFALDKATNIMVSGITNHGSSPSLFSMSSNVNVNTSDYYAINPSAAAYFTDDTVSYPLSDAYALFKLGEFDDTPFPYCGDGTCDGGETASNCATDCPCR